MSPTVALFYSQRDMLDGEVIAEGTHCLTCAYRLDQLTVSRQCRNCGAVHVNRCPECGSEVRGSVTFRERISLSPGAAGRLENVLQCASQALSLIAVALGLAGAALLALVLSNENWAAGAGSFALILFGFGVAWTIAAGCALAYAFVREFNRAIFLSLWPLLYCPLLGLLAAVIVPSAGWIASCTCAAIGALLFAFHARRRRAWIGAFALAILPVALLLFPPDFLFFVSLWFAGPVLCLATLATAIRAHCSCYRIAWWERIYPWLAVLAAIIPWTMPTGGPQTTVPPTLYAIHALLLITAILAAFSVAKLRKYLEFSRATKKM